MNLKTHPIEILRLAKPLTHVFCGGYGWSAETCHEPPEYDVSGRKQHALCRRCAERAAKRWGMTLPEKAGDVVRET